jgi:hypothetical protein
VTPERFGALADAYGGNIDRWPIAERDAAWLHLRQNPNAEGVLSAAARLDSALAGWTVPGPGAALAARIALTVARRHAHGRRLRLWLSSLGAAAALASGMAAGAIVLMLSVPATDQLSAPMYQLTVLGAPLDLETQSPSPDGER